MSHAASFMLSALTCRVSWRRSQRRAPEPSSPLLRPTRPQIAPFPFLPLPQPPVSNSLYTPSSIDIGAGPYGHPSPPFSPPPWPPIPLTPALSDPGSRHSTMSAACRRALALRSGSGWSAASAAADGRRTASVEAARHISQLTKANGKRAFLVDTLALVRRLEAQGVPTKHAEAITSAMTEVLHDSIDNVAQSVVSKSEMQRSEVIQESNISKFKSEVQSSQGHHFSLLQRETEKLKGDIENMRSELRHEIDKVTAGQRLDLNLERGRIRDELAKQNSETTDLTNKLDREIHTLRAQLEAAKYDVIKYCIGTLVSISAVGLAMIRVLM